MRKPRAGGYAVRWDGRRSKRLVRAGTYRVVQTIRDQRGNVATYRNRVTVSHQRLVSRTWRTTIPAARFSQLDQAVYGLVLRSASRYRGGVVVHGGSTVLSYAKVFYRVRIPKGAVQVKRISFCALGTTRVGAQPPFVGLSNFATRRIDWVQIPRNSRGCWGIRKKGSSASLRRYVRRGMIEGSVVSAGMYNMAFDAARVGIVVRYATLVGPRGAASDGTVGQAFEVRAVDDSRWSIKVPKALRPIMRRSMHDWDVVPPDAPLTVEHPPSPEPRETPDPNQRLLLYPSEVQADVANATKVSAWICGAKAAVPFGADTRPGTKDDRCQPVIANWRLRLPDSATISRDRGHTVLVRMTNPIENTLVASRGTEQEKRVRLVP